MKSECKIDIKIIMDENEGNEIIKEIQNMSLLEGKKVKEFPYLNTLYEHIKEIIDTYDL